VALPGRAGKRELEALVSDLAGLALDARRPLWQFQMVENYAGGAAVIMRVHHCYADGIAHTGVFLSLTDTAPEPRPRAEPPAGVSRPRPGHGGRFDFVGHLHVPGADLMRQALNQGADWIAKAADIARHPDQANDLARHALGMTVELARVAALPDDAETRLKGPLGTRKRAAWAEPLPLPEVRTVARTLGCTINDVLMATAAGALGGYLRDQGDDTDGLAIRATVPVNLRDPAEALSLGNHFGLVFLDLPIGIRDPLERVYAVRDTMAGLKTSYQPILMLGLMATLGVLGETAEDLAIDLLSSKATLVASNVPGPQYQLYLAGRRLSQLMFWVPQSGDIGLGISILSYNGQVQFGLIADRKRIPDPRAVAARFTSEFETILLAVLLGPYLSRERPAGSL
jgi:WS/DGAT/MGAT family acyltransferase